MDIAKGEMAEASIDSFIGKRDKQRRRDEGERAAEALYADNARRPAALLEKAGG